MSVSAMMLLRYITSSFVLSVALRVNEVATRVKNEEKLYSVEVGLSLTDTTVGTGSAIEFSVDGVRRMTRTHPPEAGTPVVFRHLPRGSVITAYVHASESACTYWVGATEGTACEMGDWSLSFAPLDESDQKIQVDNLYEVYVEAVGNGQPLTIEVNHAANLTHIVTANQILKFPGQHQGALVKATIAASGHTCSYLVGNKESTCELDTKWGVRIGSVAEHGVDTYDEGVHDMHDAKNYSVHLTLTPDDEVDHSKIIEIVLNKRIVARKKSGTDLGDGINLYHVPTGSVLFAVSHTTGQACGIYVGSNARAKSITCAGWTLEYSCEEEVEGSFDKDQLFDVSVSVFYGSTEPRPEYSVTSDTHVTLLLRNTPVFFPRVSAGWSGGELISPSVNNVTAPNCAHVVGGGYETSCEHYGWFFVINSRLNMNDYENWNHWVDEDDEESEEEEEEIPETYKFMILATYTGSKSKATLTCRARDDLEYVVKPKHPTFGDPLNGEDLFWSMDLEESKNQQNTVTKNASHVKFAMNSGEIAGRRRLNGGFYCTVTSSKNELLCEADTDGKSMTYENGCTVHIEIHQS